MGYRRRRRSYGTGASYTPRVTPSGPALPPQVFAGWGEFVAFAREEHRATDQFSARQNAPRDGWDFSAGFDGALDLAIHGWKQGEDTVKRISGALITRVSNKIVQHDIQYNVEGAQVDIGRFCEGEPECWQDWHESEVRGDAKQLVRIVFNCSVSSGVDATVILARGATIAALTELLEIAGHRVEVILCWGGNCYGEGGYGFVGGEVMVKPSDQPLDLGRMAFALAHPACFRRLIFSCMEANPRLSPGYGTPTQYTKYSDDPKIVYFGRALYPEETWTDPKLAEAWVIEQLKSHGVELNMPAAERA